MKSLDVDGSVPTTIRRVGRPRRVDDLDLDVVPGDDRDV